MSMKSTNDTIGNRTHFFPRNSVTNILRYLLYFAPERKPFELNRLVIFLFVYRTQLQHSIHSTSAGLCFVLPDCQKCFKAKYVLRSKHDGKRHSVPTPILSSNVVGIYRINTCEICKSCTRNNTGYVRGATGWVQMFITSCNAAHERTYLERYTSAMRHYSLAVKWSICVPPVQHSTTVHPAHIVFMCFVRI